MKAFLCAGLCGLTLFSADAETLTNLDGKIIEAEIGEISGADVVLKVGGKDFTVKLNTLSKESNQLLGKVRDERKAAMEKAAMEKRAAELAAKGTFEEITRPFEHQLQDTKAVFEDFYSKGHPKERDQFETQAEYEARLSKPFDSTQILAFEITHEASYAYDIDNQKMTVSAGGVWSDPAYSHYKTRGNVPFKFFGRSQAGAGYEAITNSGQKFTVKESELHRYFMHLTNGLSLPETLRIPIEDRSEIRGYEKFALKISLPRDRAKEIASRLALICRVKFIDYSKGVPPS